MTRQPTPRSNMPAPAASETTAPVSLDTSVVLRLLTGLPEAQAQAARRALTESPQPIVVDDVVVAECYHALRHHYRVPHADAARALHLFVSGDSVRATGQCEQVLATAINRMSPGFMDQLIHAVATQHGGSLLTFDRALAQLPDVRLIAS